MATFVAKASTRKQHGRLAFTIRALDSPPPEAGPCAGLISLASQALTAPEAVEYLDGLLARCGIHWPGRTKILQMEPHRSAGFRAVAATRLNAIRIRRPGIRTTFPQPTTHQTKLAATDIPQRLPDTWTAQLHGLGVPMHGPHLRRDAAIRLVQMAHGGTRREAAISLGFDACTAHNTSMRLRQWQASDDHARHYQQALARLADHITTTPRLIDYRWRRDDLSQWVISEEDWDVITESVRRRQTPTGRPLTKWLHTRRLAAAVFVWTHVTGGERLYAPVLRDLRNRRSPHLRAIANESWSLEHPQRTSSIHALLAAARSEYAAGLATRIDQQVPPSVPRKRLRKQRFGWPQPSSDSLHDLQQLQSLACSDSCGLDLPG
ncbi:hypothetical protein [Streptomyces sp. NPDC094472]|uniref:hypothetical protein n=1 Tax=Streptomyces sp. NPDC094472 TaxID=3155080 RepID=UPI0033178113